MGKYQLETDHFFRIFIKYMKEEIEFYTKKKITISECIYDIAYVLSKDTEIYNKVIHKIVEMRKERKLIGKTDAQ